MTVAEYRREHGDFAFYMNGNLQFMTSDVAILYDADTFTFHKHGPEEKVAKVMKEYNDKWPDGTRPFKMVASREWEVEDLNRILSTSGALQGILRRLGLEQT